MYPYIPSNAPTDCADKIFQWVSKTIPYSIAQMDLARNLNNNSNFFDFFEIVYLFTHTKSILISINFN
jgi:hypothetical protein